MNEPGDIQVPEVTDTTTDAAGDGAFDGFESESIIDRGLDALEERSNARAAAASTGSEDGAQGDDEPHAGGGAEDAGEAEAGDDAPVAQALDWGEYTETLPDGRVVLRVDRAPDGVVFAYGDDEKDWFDKGQFDHRRSAYDRRMSELDKQRREVGEIYTPAGENKVELYDAYEQQLSTAPDEFVRNLAAECIDPVKTAWEIIKNHAPDFARAVSPAFQDAAKQGLYDPTMAAKVAAERQQKRLEQERNALEMERIKMAVRGHLTEYAGHVVKDSEFSEVEKMYKQQYLMWQNWPQEYQQPTWRGAWDAFVSRRGAGGPSASGGKQPQTQASPDVVPTATPPKVNRPSGGGGGSAGGKPKSSLDMIREWRDEIGVE